MELVYLWVEDYKNIHRQGFNFSSRFHCEFKAEYEEDENEKEKLKDNCELVICDKKKNECEDNDYIENFFGDNINVTAIVGKNGSGKSSVLKLILMSIFYDIHKGLDRGDKFMSPETFDRVNYKNKNRIEKQFENKLFLVFKNGDKLKKISIRTPFECNKDISELRENELNFFTIHFNYMLDTLYDGYHDSWIKEIYHKADNYETPLLLEPYKNNYDREVIDIEIINYLNNQKILKFYSIFNDMKILSFFNPNKIKYIINKNKIIQKLVMLNQRVPEKTDFLDEYKLSEKIDELISNQDFETLNNIYFYTKASEEFEFIPPSSKHTNDNFVEKINTFINDNEYKGTPKDTLISWLSIKEYIPYHYKKLENSLKFKFNIIDKNKSQLFNEKIDKMISLKDNIELLENIPPWVDIEFYDDTVSINSLSSGEKSLFTLLINLMYQVENISQRDGYQTINLFLDETELGLHPDWQKKYLADILRALKIITNKTINLVFATHSPFLLSDIPKQNIIFLDKDEEGKCKVVDGLNEKKQTFGANIHTLLSDSFFMEEGLMGEFAKNKIQEIIYFLNNEKNDLTKDEILPLIEIIGEHFLKDKLKEQYFKKYPEEKRINREIEILKQKINKLEEEKKNDSNKKK